MKFLATLVLALCFSFKGAGQRFLVNTNYSFHRFYDSGSYSFKWPEGARANLVTLGVLYNWRQFDIGISSSFGILKNMNYQGTQVPKTNSIGGNAILNYHFLKADHHFYLDPFVSCGYGFKNVPINSKLVTYSQAAYGLGINFEISEKVAITLSESFNLSFKNMHFNNFQAAVGLVWLITGQVWHKLPEDFEFLNQKIKDDSLMYARQLKDLEFKFLFKERKLRDSLIKQIDLQKKNIDKLVNDKNKLLGSSVTLKSQIDEIRKSSWTSYDVFKLTKDTLIKINKLPAGEYASYTANCLPDAKDRKKIIEIKGSIYICTNPYNYHKICIEANSKEPIIPPDFLKYYPLAELLKMEGD